MTIDYRGYQSIPIVLSTVSIPAGASRLLWDAMMMISDPSVILASGLAMSMTDTSAIDISIQSSGQVLDTFAVWSAQVVSYDNTKTSFARIRSDGWLITGPTCTWSVYNVYSPRLANPGMIWSACAFSDTWQNSAWSTNTWDTSTGTNLSGSLFTGDTNSWSYLSGDILTGDMFSGNNTTWSYLSGDVFSGDGEWLSPIFWHEPWYWWKSILNWQVVLMSILSFALLYLMHDQSICMAWDLQIIP